MTAFEFSELQDTELKHPEHELVDIISIKGCPGYAAYGGQRAAASQSMACQR